VGTTARYNRASPITKLDDQTDIEIAMGAGTWDLDRRANRWVTQGEIDGLTAALRGLVHDGNLRLALCGRHVAVGREALVVR
jgi:hypothetical protein